MQIYLFIYLKFLDRIWKYRCNIIISINSIGVGRVIRICDKHNNYHSTDNRLLNQSSGEGGLARPWNNLLYLTNSGECKKNTFYNKGLGININTFDKNSITLYARHAWEWTLKNSL